MKSSPDSSSGTGWQDYVLPAALALAWVASAIAQSINAPTLGAEVIATATGLPLIAWAMTKLRIGRAKILLLVAALVPVAVMFFMTLRSSTPLLAMTGVGPSWQGWILWGAVFGWFGVALLAADHRDLARVVVTLTWLGAATAAWALIEAAGMFATYQERSGPSAMALFDSPLSMGQALVITIAATVSLAVRRGISQNKRVLYAGLALMQFAALFAAGARAAIVGVLVMAAAFGLLQSGATPMSRAVRGASVAVLGVFMAGFAALSVAWTGHLGSAAYLRADALLSGRFSIWNHVTDRISEHILLGTGPAAFDSILSWDALSDGRIAAEVTYDQHSLLMSWLTNTGLLGLAAFGFAALMLGLEVARSVGGPRSSASARIIAAGGAGLFVSMLTSWPEPLALLSISLLMGALVGNGSLRDTPLLEATAARSPRVVVIAAAAASAALIAFVALVPAVGARASTAKAPDYQDLIRRVELARSTTHDHSYLASELTLISRRGELAASDEQVLTLLRGLAADYPAEANDSVEIPLLALDLLWNRAGLMSQNEFWELSRFFAERGSAADPGSGVWRYCLARAASVAARDQAPEYRQAALNQELPDSARLYLQFMR